jgi:pimeloyl-ACP methyl ester carboxylesterase
MTRAITFVHGMFMTPRCWTRWIDRFAAAGYTCSAPAWPHHDAPPAELRARHPDAALGALTLDALVEHHARAVGETRPIVIGHSMGGLIAQLLVARGLAACAVLIDSAPPKGVTSMKWSFLKSNWPVVSPFANKREPFLPSVEQFRYAFAHTLPVEAVRAIWEEHVTPESRLVGRGPLSAAAKLDFAAPHAPLAFVAGELDHIIPASLNAANFRKYKHADSVTEHKMFPGRTHYILGQDGWEEVADHARAFIERVVR